MALFKKNSLYHWQFFSFFAICKAGVLRLMLVKTSLSGLIKKGFLAAGLRVERVDYAFELSIEKIFSSYSDYTMIPKSVFLDNLRLCQDYKYLSGCVVECGVWRGGMIASIAKVLGQEHKYYLFDSFEGLPDAKEIDGESALKWQSNNNGEFYHDNCSADMKFAEQAMKLSLVKDFQLVKGWFSDTLPNFEFDDEIAILRLDGDWYDSTMQCLESLYPKVVDGGLIIVDDYYVWDGCSRAVHDYLSRQNLACRVYRTPNGCCYLIKS